MRRIFLRLLHVRIEKTRVFFYETNPQNSIFPFGTFAKNKLRTQHALNIRIVVDHLLKLISFFRKKNRTYVTVKQLQML